MWQGHRDDAGRLERLRFVTRRFTSLHGLRWFVLGPAILSAFWLQPYLKSLRHSGPVRLLLGLLGTLAPFVFVLVGIPLIERYYRQRFGSVRGAVRAKWPSLPDALIFLGVAVFELTKFERSGSSVLLVAGCVTCLHVTVRDWPWRGYYICPAIVCAAFARSLAHWFAGSPAHQFPARQFPGSPVPRIPPGIKV